MFAAAADAARDADAVDRDGYDLDGLTLPEVLYPSRIDLIDRINNRSSAADGLFACLMCTERFDSLKSVDLHRKKAHQLPRTQQERVRRGTSERARKEIQASCPVCDERLSNMQGLLRHYLRKHVDERLYTCSKCGVAFKVRRGESAHLPDLPHALTRDCHRTDRQRPPWPSICVQICERGQRHAVPAMRVRAPPHTVVTSALSECACIECVVAQVHLPHWVPVEDAQAAHDAHDLRVLLDRCHG